MVSGRQIRAARALLGISATELAELAEVGWATVQRLERNDGISTSRNATITRVRGALKSAGIEFFGDPIQSPGVRLMVKPKD